MTFPQALSPKATATFNKIIKGCENVGDSNQIFSDNGFMPVSVECIGEITTGSFAGTKVYSICHFYSQNSDLMRDPEVTFYKFVTGKVFPASYRQDGLGIDRTYMTIEDEKIRFNANAQKDLVSFCAGTWFPNIEEQNDLDAQ